MTEETKELTYHDKAVLINAMMLTDGWKAFNSWFSEKKKALEERISRNETDIEIGGIEKKDDNITIVVLNKDELKIRLAFIRILESELQGFQIEATKPEEKGGQSER